MPVSPYEGQVGQKGKRLCRECGTETKPPRRTFCSDPCVSKWKERSPSYQRDLVFARDNGVCAICRLDCLKLQNDLNDLGRQILTGGTGAVAALDRFRAALVQHSIPRHKHGFHSVNSLWEMDHIVPVVEGGGNSDLGNLRTLCWKDHAVETAALRKRLAEKRRRT